MEIILVTGKSGSGKSTFAKLLADKLNYIYIDIDKLSHKIYENKIVIDKARELFGEEIFDNDGTFNRKKLGNIFFGEKSARVAEYSDFTYNFIIKEIDSLLTQNAVLDYILLPQTKYWNFDCTKILVKSVNDTRRFDMIKKRDNISDEYLQKRESASIDYNINDFDFVIVNDYTLKTLYNKVEDVFNHINKQ